MKKLLGILVLASFIVLTVPQAFADTYGNEVKLENEKQTKAWRYKLAEQEGIPYMYEKGLTKFNTMESFKYDSKITREQAAKFFVKLAEDVGIPQTSKGSCSFKDKKTIDTTLLADVMKACELGIIKGSNGNFNPKRYISKAETIAILFRVIRGKETEKFSGENCPYAFQSQGCKRYSMYMARALSLMPLTRKDIIGEGMNIHWDAQGYYTRGEIAVLLYLASQLGEYNSIAEKYEYIVNDANEKLVLKVLPSYTIDNANAWDNRLRLSILDKENDTSICIENTWNGPIPSGAGPVCPYDEYPEFPWRDGYEGVEPKYKEYKITIDHPMDFDFGQAFNTYYGPKIEEQKRLFEFYTKKDENGLTAYAKMFGPIFTLYKE